MDQPLRTALWNAVHSSFFEPHLRLSGTSGNIGYYAQEPLTGFIKLLATEVVKVAADALPIYWSGQLQPVRDYYMKAPWFAAYEFIEAVVALAPAGDRPRIPGFIAECNRVLERELSAYRFAGTQLVRITDATELRAIEDARRQTGRLNVVQQHFDTALRHLSDRENPDFRNSIKESISAVESFCSLMAGQDRADLDAALRVLEAKLELHPALKRAFKALYGYSSDANGIRHALLEEANLTFDDAKFMLVACAAFVNYLTAQAAKASLPIT